MVNYKQSVPIRLKFQYAQPIQAECRVVKRRRYKVGDDRVYFQTGCVASIQFAQVKHKQVRISQCIFPPFCDFHTVGKL